jgi:hypothetical protein
LFFSIFHNNYQWVSCITCCIILLWKKPLLFHKCRFFFKIFPPKSHVLHAVLEPEQKNKL